MTKKKFTFEEWYEGKVVLEYARRIGSKKPTIVNWDDFSNEDKIKIQDEQKSIFNQSVINLKKEVEKDFFNRYEITNSKIDLVNIYLKRFSDVFNGKMICNDYSCRTNDSELIYDTWFYEAMRMYIRQYFIGGQLYDFSNVHSPNSPYWDKEMKMPEVLVEVFGYMIRMLKAKTQNSSVSSEQKNETTIDSPSDQTIDISNQNNPTLEGFDARFFNGDDAYILFLKFKSALKARTSRTQKKENSSPSEVAKYSTIFNFLKEKSYIYKGVNHKSFIDYLKKVHNANIPDRCVKFPYQPSENDLNTLRVLYKSWKSKD